MMSKYGKICHDLKKAYSWNKMLSRMALPRILSFLFHSDGLSPIIILTKISMDFSILYFKWSLVKISKNDAFVPEDFFYLSRHC